MGELFSGIATHTPLWVWPLLVVLLALGARATRPRLAPIYPQFLLPLLGVSALATVRGLDSPLAMPVFALALAAGAAWGFHHQKRLIIEKTGRMIRLRGEWATLAVILVIFGARFAEGTLRVVAPAVHGWPAFALALSVCLGAASGLFLGRAIRVIGAPQGRPA